MELGPKPEDASTVRCKFSMITKSEVPSFGPPVPADALFALDSNFRDYIVTKCIQFRVVLYLSLADKIVL